MPEAADLPERLDGVLAVLFLVVTRATSPPATATRCGPSSRARPSGWRPLRRLLPEEPEVTGLLGMLVLIEARREARVRNGQLVPLAEQDRAGWDRALIREGHDLVRAGRPGGSRG